jgi:hypothetical protein
MVKQTYAEWKSTREWPATSYDSFKMCRPDIFEYQVFELDLDTKMSHIEGEPLLETDSLGEASVFIYEAFKNEGRELCVFQPRHNDYRGYYRKSNKHSTRNRAGQFTKA